MRPEPMGRIGAMPRLARRAMLVVAFGLPVPALAGLTPSQLRGEQLFVGSAALPGRVHGHVVALPVAATRWINCHAQTQQSRSATARAGANVGLAPASVTVAPALKEARLSELRVRLGGPKTRYDAALLCRVLRHGVNSAQVVVPTTMPRYDASDAQCEDLWNYLSNQP